MRPCGLAGSAAAATSPTPRLPARVHSLRLYREHYNGITQMHRAVVQKWHALVPPCARAAAANIAAAAGYSGRGRRPVAATPSARLFSEHNLQHTFFANKYRRCQRTRSFTIFTKSYSKKKCDIFAPINVSPVFLLSSLNRFPVVGIHLAYAVICKQKWLFY